MRVFGTKCLDIPYNNPSYALQVWDCVGTPQQKWNLIDSGYPRVQIIGVGRPTLRVSTYNYPPNVSQAIRLVPATGTGWFYFDYSW